MVIRYTTPGIPIATSKGVVLEPRDKSDADANARFERHGGVRLTGETVSLPKADAKPREIYLGGKTVERLKPWLLTNPPTSRRT